MRINVHDKFKSWQHFIDVVKQLYKFTGFAKLFKKLLTNKEINGIM